MSSRSIQVCLNVFFFQVFKHILQTNSKKSNLVKINKKKQTIAGQHEAQYPLQSSTNNGDFYKWTFMYI